MFCICILLQSPFAPFAKGIPDNDNSIFVTMAKNIIQGDILYKDITDHKGPVIFFVNALALMLFKGKLIGIWVFEVLSMWLASFFMYRTARMKCSETVSLAVTILSLGFVVPLLMGGNLTEEWALPCISIAMYLFVKYLYGGNKPMPIFSLFVLSLTFLIAFLLKASYVGIWVGFGLVIMAKLLINKKYREFFFDFFVVIFSMLIILLPIVLYFQKNEALGDAWYWMISYNIQYGDGLFIKTLSHWVRTLLGLKHIPIMVLITFCLILYKKDDHNMYVYSAYLLSFLITAFSTAIGNRYEHYNIIFTPLFVYVYGTLFNFININTRLKEIVLLTLALGSGYLYSIKNSAICNYSNMYVERLMDKSMTMDIVEAIDANSSPGDYIIGDDITRSIYVYTHCKCVNKYMCNSYSHNVTDEIIVKKPTIVVRNSRHIGTPLEVSETLMIEHYRFIVQHGEYEVWRRITDE